VCARPENFASGMAKPAKAAILEGTRIKKRARWISVKKRDGVQTFCENSSLCLELLAAARY
jgi:hypothetical protein